MGRAKLLAKIIAERRAAKPKPKCRARPPPFAPPGKLVQEEHAKLVAEKQAWFLLKKIARRKVGIVTKPPSAPPAPRRVPA